MNEIEIRERFETCLLTEEEMNLGPEVWVTGNNPFESEEEEEEKESDEEES